MNEKAKQGIALALGAALAAGGTFTLTQEEVKSAHEEILTLKDQKHEVLKQYVWAQARIGEVPTLDLTYVSTEEYTAAFAELATEKDAFKQDDLFKGLEDKASDEGLKCFTFPDSHL